MACRIDDPEPGDDNGFVALLDGISTRTPRNYSRIHDARQNIAAMAQRSGNDADTGFATALGEVEKAAGFNPVAPIDE